MACSLPEGMRASELRHPAPSPLEVAGLASYVHEGSYALLTKFLARQGRNSIPHYLFYGAGQPARKLPQILTPGLLEAAADSSGGSETKPG